MLITITIVSILCLTALVRLAEKALPFSVCPICAGVFLTWAGLLVAHSLGYQINLVVPALLMGGSVVGIAYQLEKKFRGLSADRILLWKTIFIPTGFVAAYSVLEQLWTTFFLAIAALFLLSFALLSLDRRAGQREGTAEEIEKKMRDCC